ncbi:MAG TPA: HAMP domain-containing sensor histidine kinase [Myxococcota bacterium]|nr:HAMP domain-containing sensor histidine kinase [Myxococcota bacterium]
MWRTIRNRHLASTQLGLKAQVIFSLLTAGIGLLFFAFGYPLWRVALLVTLPLGLACFEVYLVRNTPVDEFDRVHQRMSLGALTMMGILIAVTGGLQGPLAPFLFITALTPVLLFGDLAYVFWQQARVVAIVLILGVLPEEVLGPPMPRLEHTILTATLALVGLLGIALRVRQFVRAAKAAFLEIERMREERVAEAGEQLVRLQGVSSRIAHELKNPLAAIKSLVQLTSRTVGERERERLEVVQEEVARMEVILRDYLSYSRPLDDLKVAPLDLGEVVSEVVAVMSARAETEHLRLEVDTPATPLSGDARRLKEALINLVGNAIEASTRGGRVAIRCQPTADGATLTIEDTGRGMAPDELARVGTPFHTTRPGGTGLGVHLARGVIAQHGGTLTFESEPGQGTRVHIALPKVAPRVEGLPTVPAEPSLEPWCGPRDPEPVR